jgi:hypothetical protein
MPQRLGLDSPEADNLTVNHDHRNLVPVPLTQHRVTIYVDDLEGLTQVRAYIGDHAKCLAAQMATLAAQHLNPAGHDFTLAAPGATGA